MWSKEVLIDRVDNERWQNAQAWERDHWLRDQKALARYGKNLVWRLLSLFGVVEKYRGDDRNRWWRDAFDNYSFLPQTVDNALEVGCGPYTNMRLIRTQCNPRHLYLSDPLIRTYVQLNMTFVNEMYRDAACCLDDHPLEELPFADDYFDLVVMINVLDHVRDADQCMKSLTRVLKHGGFAIIGQDLSDLDDLKRQPEGLRVGHPIALDERWFEPYLKGRFNRVLYKVLPRDVGWAPQWHYGTLCFAGTKE
jgi:ubiquinone/menaquinone biosynthesis C-methylase UbiE